MVRRREASQFSIPVNWADWLLELGRRVRRRLRSGCGISEAARRESLEERDCQFALAFTAASDVVKLRALVEDWSSRQLVAELARTGIKKNSSVLSRFAHFRA